MTHRATQLLAQPLVESQAPARATQLLAQVVAADKTLPIRVTQLFVQAATSLQQGVTPGETVLGAAIPIVDSSFIGVDDVIPRAEPFQPVIVDREANPFRPDLAQPVSPRVPGMINDLQPQRASVGLFSQESSQPATASVDRATPAAMPFPVAEPVREEQDRVRVIIDSVRETQELARQTHEKNQAGDTTVPWEFLTRLSSEQLFTPGCIGRFYHDDFGIILARYVKFIDMDSSFEWINAPVGRLKASQVFAWEVTNRFSKSSAFLAEGIIASYTMPRSGQYGWITISGANHTRLFLKDTPRSTQWQNLSWQGDEALTGNGAGTILGYIVGSSGSTRLDPGRVFIQVGGATEAQIKTYFDDSLAEIQAIFDEIAERLEALEGSENPASLEQLTAQVAQLRTDLTRETASRNAAVQALNSRFDSLDYVSGAELTAYDSVIRNYIDTQDNTIRAAANTAIARANEALTKVNAIPDISAEITRLDNAIGAVNSSVSTLLTRYLPIGPIADRPTTPSIDPGTFSFWYATDTNVLSVYDSSIPGWVDITGGGGGPIALDDLTDVDTTTTPPVTGNVLRFNGTQWAPAVPTGGSASPSAYAAVTKNTNQVISGVATTITYQTVLADTNGLWNAATNSFIIPSSLDGKVAVLSFQSQATSDSNGFLEGWIERSLDGGATWAIVGWSANGGIDHFGIASSAFVDRLVTGARYRVQIQIQAGATLLGNSRNRFAIGVVEASSATPSEWQLLDGSGNPISSGVTRNFATSSGVNQDVLNLGPYKDIRVVINGVTRSVSSFTYLRVSHDNGATFAASGYRITGSNADNVTFDFLPSANAGARWGVIEMPNIKGARYFPRVAYGDARGFGMYTGNSADINAVRVECSGGVMNGGTLLVYGRA